MIHFIYILRSAATTPTVKNLCEAFEKQDLRSYTIYVHGIKGALRNVGMKELGDLAYELELAGKRDDKDYILRQHESFMDKFRLFSDTAMRITENAKRTPSENGELSELRDYIQELISAAEDMDYSNAKKITDILSCKTYGEKLDGKIKSLCRMVDDFDFEQVSNTAAGMMD